MFQGGWSGVALAHNEAASNIHNGGAMASVLDQVTSLSLNSIYIAAFVVTALVVTALALKPTNEVFKNFLFWPIVIVVSLATITMTAATIYLNAVSYSKGPAHWHADFELWACGQEHELVDPRGFSNKVGTSVLHEHNDKRIHLEGVVVSLSDASLGNFFRTIGGELSNDTITLPTNEGVFHRHNGDRCDTQPGEVQVFAFKTDHGKIIQEKLSDPANFVYLPHSKVPPGNCIIVEFDTPKKQTDKLCRSYRVEIERGKATYGL